MSCSQGFPMLSGLNQASYAANSGPQNSVLLRCRPLLENAILQHMIEYNNAEHQQYRSSRQINHVFRVADMGCSSGPNCLANMQFMLDKIRKYKNTSAASTCNDLISSSTPPPPDLLELQAFFCDLPTNDFNTLVQLHDAECSNNINRLSSAGSRRPAAQYEAISYEYGHDCTHAYDVNAKDGNRITGQYNYRYANFFAAVPGTVYGRLFPRSSLDLVFSSCCLHWLSQVPTIVSDPKSNEWNKDKIWVDGPRANEATGRVYAQQWKKDLETFFSCRMEEMVSGGMIFLIIPCRPNSFPPHQQQEDSCFRCLEIAWQQLIHEGVVDQSDLDTFNIPKYLPTPIEIKSTTNLVPNLRVEKLEVIEEPIGDNYWQQWSNDPSEFAKRKSRFYKSAFWNVIEGHVGIHKCEAIFERFEGLMKMALEKRTSWDSYWAHAWSSYAVVQLFKEF